jgi:hypothetical protein
MAFTTTAISTWRREVAEVRGRLNHRWLSFIDAADGNAISTRPHGDYGLIDHRSIEL